MLEDLPVELVGANILGYLFLKDIVMLERASCSKKSHQAYLEYTRNCAPVELPSRKHATISVLQWFAKKNCRISLLEIRLTADNPVFKVSNLKVDNFCLLLDSDTTTDNLKLLKDNNMGGKVKELIVRRNQNKEVMEQLSVCTGNVKHLSIRFSNHCMDWLTNILSRWKLTEFDLADVSITTPILNIILQTCTKLTSIKLSSDTVDDAAVIAIAQHCPKLETLTLRSSNITWTSLLALSERYLSLKDLYTPHIPNIPTIDIARRCSHALSCIRHVNTNNLYQNGQDASLLIPYMTGLTSVPLNYYCDSYIPLLTQHCRKLTTIIVADDNWPVSDILSFCHTYPLLQVFNCYRHTGVTDTVLIELLHACPHIHTMAVD